MTQKAPKNFALMISVLGIVYGDIGTSPLYALKSCFTLGHLSVNEASILGITSLLIWGLFIVVSIKYISLVMKADYQGEGGILALSSLTNKLKLGRFTGLPLALGLLGTALFFGDGIITPAISILSALEGLHIIAPDLSAHVVGASILILLILFAMQSRGSGAIGQYFGPIMTIWFATLALLGLYQIIRHPFILMALNPYYALTFLINHGTLSFVVLGGAILAFTGAEALYADMGHFGKAPIRFSWNYFVFPALLLNYLGQGSLLLHTPAAISNPFYLLAPSFALYPLIILATVATIIASQSVISGVFTISWQGIMLGYLPRMKVVHTSHHHMGQVYVPVINAILCFLTILAVVNFENSANFAAAYGLSVSGVMLITTIMVFLLAYKKWNWKPFKLALVFVPLACLDSLFVVTSFSKVFEGAWFTLLITFVVIYVVRVWMEGNKALRSQKFNPDKSLKSYILQQKERFPQTLPGTAIFLCRHPNKVPNSLDIHLAHNKFMHETTLFVSMITTGVPYVQRKEKYLLTPITPGCFSIAAKYGFKEAPDLNRLLNWAKEQNVLPDSEDVSFFLSKGVAIISKKGFFKRFSLRLYVYLSKNSLAAFEFYKIPHDKVVELGVRYRI